MSSLKDPVHLPEKHFPERTFPRKKLGLMDIFPNVHFPELTLARMYIWPNGHFPNVQFPEWTLARMYIWPNGHFPENQFSRMDTCSCLARRAGLRPPPVGLPIKMQNKKNTSFLALLRLIFALELTKK